MFHVVKLLNMTVLTKTLMSVCMRLFSCWLNVTKHLCQLSLSEVLGPKSYKVVVLVTYST